MSTAAAPSEHRRRQKRDDARANTASAVPRREQVARVHQPRAERQVKLSEFGQRAFDLLPAETAVEEAARADSARPT